MTLAPPITALIGFLFLGESLMLLQTTGIAITVLGIVIAMLGKEKGEKLNFKVPFKGFLFALGGAVGQALGLIISKKGIGHYDAMAATQIRAFTGGLCFFLLVTFMYGLEYSAALQKDNFYAVQFHPEKSGDVGQKILENFLKL